MNGPAVRPKSPYPENDWLAWGEPLRALDDMKMWDDGTHGDAITGDSIYSVQFPYNAQATIGQLFKFGIKGFDTECGFGNNHYEVIDVNNPVIASYWGSIDPFFYDAWDWTFSNLSTNLIQKFMPSKFALEPNYPNPFNPSTSIQFSIPHGAEVSLSVYDINGRLISTIYNGFTMPGTYETTWNAKDQASGTYYYEISADPYYKETGKMVLIK